MSFYEAHITVLALQTILAMTHLKGPFARKTRCTHISMAGSFPAVKDVLESVLLIPSTSGNDRSAGKAAAALSVTCRLTRSTLAFKLHCPLSYKKKKK